MGQLCESCDEDKSGVSRSIEFLENEGFVERKAAEGRVYKTQLTLTEKGSAVASDICEKIDYILSESSKNVTAEEREVFYKALRQISDNLDGIEFNK